MASNLVRERALRVCVFLTIGLSLKLPVFSGELVWIIFTPKLCIIAASLTMDTLAISNERERERRLHC